MSTSRTRSKSPARVWQRMLSGRRLDLLDPSPLDIEIEDIAHGLARVARWNGQTIGPNAFSVAQHSLMVEDIVRRIEPALPLDMQMAALLHDAPEYVVGDMISPFKAVLGDDYKTVEHRLSRAVHVRFGLPAELPARVKKLIKQADLMSAWLEATRLAGFTQTEADRFFIRPDFASEFELTPLSPSHAQQAFLARHEVLLSRLDGLKGVP